MTASPLVDKLIKRGVFDGIEEIENRIAAFMISKNSMNKIDPRSGRLPYWMELLGFRPEWKKASNRRFR